MLNIALPKGRLGDKVYRLLEASGFACPEILEESRKLVFENVQAGLRYMLVKPSDVAIYVAHGAADVGVVGKDILAEGQPDVYELLDLGFGRCHMCVAAREDYEEDPARPVRVAKTGGGVPAAEVYRYEGGALVRQNTQNDAGKEESTC